jgi:hypothetical protein
MMLCFISFLRQLVPSSPAPSVSAWGSSVVSSPSLAQIQTEESKLRQGQQQQQQPSRGSSFQLKSLLGLSSTPSASMSAVTAAEPNAWESAAVPSSAAAQPPSPSLKEILRQEQAKQHEQAQLKHHQAQLLMQQQVRSAREIAASESATAAVIAAASWSAVGAGAGPATGPESTGRGNAPKAALSLRDIMQLEEASSAASQSSTAPSDSPFASAPRPAPGSWAAKASLSTSGGAGGGGVPVTTASSRQSAAVAAKSTSSSSAAKKPAAAAVAVAAPAPTPIVPPPASGPSFGSGHKCPPAELSEWCVAQLTKIRAADSSSAADPSEFFGVLEYCATLESAVEVRETFSAYLGSTTMVRPGLTLPLPCCLPCCLETHQRVYQLYFCYSDRNDISLTHLTHCLNCCFLSGFEFRFGVPEEERRPQSECRWCARRELKRPRRWGSYSS